MKSLFIINPRSGGQSNTFIKEEILKIFPDAAIKFTDSAGHAKNIALKNADNFDAVIAVGGDGTANETASALVGKKTAFGLIPRGSGNGFAREIGLSLDPLKAIRQLKTAKKVLCDVGEINGEFFINLAGIGIEAEIAHWFAVHGKRGGTRGWWPYFKIGAKKVFYYKPKKFSVSYNGKKETKKPLTLVFANGRQYGNNFKIAPKASFSDGLLDMVEVPPDNFFSMLLALPSFFSSRRQPFDRRFTTKVKEALVEHERRIVYHIDGEPRMTNKPLHIKTVPRALNVLMPKI